MRLRYTTEVFLMLNKKLYNLKSRYLGLESTCCTNSEQEDALKYKY